DASVAADPSLLAAAAPGTGAGDNQGALALIALHDQLVAGGGTRTFVDESIHLIGAVGTAARTASDQSDLEAAPADVLSAARDSLSGVSQEDELTKLASYQHAHEAATQFVSTVNDLLSDLIAKI